MSAAAREPDDFALRAASTAALCRKEAATLRASGNEERARKVEADARELENYVEIDRCGAGRRMEMSCRKPEMNAAPLRSGPARPARDEGSGPRRRAAS